MARAEIDSFILKFKNLLLTGRSATLILKSNAGKAEVNLNVEVGHVHPPSGQYQKSRNEPSRQRRRLRRAAQRTSSETEKVEEVNAEEAIESAKNIENESVVTDREVLQDELCSDDAYAKEAEKESEVVQVERILVEADCQADWKDDDVIKLVEAKLMIIGIKMKSIQVYRNIRKYFESCVVMIEPTDKKYIEKQIFPIQRWTMRCIL